MRLIFFIFILVMTLNAKTNIDDSFNNVNNSVIKIVYQVLGEDAKKEIVDKLASQIITHFESINQKLDNLSNNKEISDYLLKQIKIAEKSQISLKDQLDKSEQERQKTLQELKKLQKETKDNDYVLILQKAQKALEAYDETTYRKILDEYQSNQKMQETIKNYANAFYLKSESYYRELNYTQAKTQIEEAIKFDNTNEQYLHWYGYILKDLGEYDDALKYYQASLALQQKATSNPTTNTASTYNNIGMVYDAKGEYDKALEYYQKDLAISEKVLGGEHQGTATSYNNIGSVYQAKGEYDKALEYYQKALAIREKVLGGEHPDTATSYNNIGTVYRAKGEYDKALEYHQKALAIREKVLGGEHPHTAVSYNNIGGIYQAKGEYDKALEYYQKDLAISEKVLGGEHPDTATSYNNMAILYYNMQKYQESAKMMQKAVDIREKVLPANHPNLIGSKEDLETIKAKL